MENTFYNTFQPVILFAQVCGLMPVTGILGNDGEQIRFTWTNPLHLYDIAMSGVALFFDYFNTAENLKTDFSIDKYASTVFYTVCLLTTVLFLRVAQHLPDIARDFSIIESSMPEYEEPKRLGLKIKLFLSTFVILATVEHGSMGVLHYRRALEIAGNDTDDIGRAYYETYFKSVSLTVPYSSVAPVILTLTNAICTFNWNFLDFFLIGMSLEVAAKFNQISKRLTALDNNNDAWTKIYTDYGRIVALTKKMDKTFSGIILTSFFSNLYHLSLQLMRSLSISGTLFHKLYFYFSLSYLILRLLTTLFCLANVNEAGKRPKDIIFSLESNSVSSVRLLQRVLTDDVHFTGNGMFIITRSFVFSDTGIGMIWRLTDKVIVKAWSNWSYSQTIIPVRLGAAYDAEPFPETVDYLRVPPMLLGRFAAKILNIFPGFASAHQDWQHALVEGSLLQYERLKSNSVTTKCCPGRSGPATNLCCEGVPPRISCPKYRCRVKGNKVSVLI